MEFDTRILPQTFVGAISRLFPSHEVRRLEYGGLVEPSAEAGVTAKVRSPLSKEQKCRLRSILGEHWVSQSPSAG